MEVPAPERLRFWHSVTFKLLVIGLLTLIMMIPGAMIRKLITERERTQLEVISEIGSKWGYGQTLCGPVLSVPYYHFMEEDQRDITEAGSEASWNVLHLNRHSPQSWKGAASGCSW
jgi:inner membrane protein